MSRARARLDAALGAALAGLMALAVLNVLWQVASRYVLQSPSSFTDELARYLLMWIGLLGAAYGVGQRLHVAMDLWPARLDARGGGALALVADAGVLGFALVVWVVGGGRLVALVASLGQTSAALGVPLAAVYAALPVSGLIVAAYVLLGIVERRRERAGEAS